MRVIRRAPVPTSRYRYFITAMPGTVIWSYVDGTRRTTPTAKGRMKEKKKKKRVVLTSAGRAVVNRNKMCRTSHAFKCDRVSVTMIKANVSLLLCTDYSLQLDESVTLAIAFTYGYSDGRYDIIQFHIQLGTIQVSKSDSTLQSGRYGTIES